MNALLMYPPSPRHRASLEAAAPGATLRVARDEATARRLIEDADLVLGNRYFLQSLPCARRLRWMQSNSAGVDRILQGGIELGDLVITCARGVYDDEVAEHALAVALALVRDLHLARDSQRERRWPRAWLPRLAEQRALVLGWGGVGRGIAHRLAALGATVEGARRREPAGGDAAGFRLWGPSSWRAALARTDLLFLALPLTPETHHLVGVEELAALPRGARVVNVGRGGTLDEGALLAALRNGHLAGAALDVLEQEPAAPDSPLWSEPRLLITPHVARSAESPPFRWEPLFVENLGRFARGEPLLHVVDRKAGY